jgi:hypothetical protein
MKNILKFNDFLNENLKDDIYVKSIGVEYSNELYSMITNFNSSGNPYLGLFKGEKIIGGILLDEDYLPWEFRFDVVIKRGYRGKGYLKLLIDKLKEDFYADKDADQLSATVVNKKLTPILVNRFGFSCGKYEGDDFVWITKKTS